MSDPVTRPAPHPLLHAGRWMLGDLLSTLVFVALYGATHNIYMATGLAIALGLGHIVYLKLRNKPIDPMQWLSLFLVVVFGGATLLTHDPIFVMLKPTVIYTAVGIVMLRHGWMTRYVPPLAQVHAGSITDLFGRLWAGLMFVTAAANLGFGLYARPAVWAAFIGVFPLASKCALVGIQYAVTRRVVRGRIRASKAPGANAG